MPAGWADIAADSGFIFSTPETVTGGGSPPVVVGTVLVVSMTSRIGGSVTDIGGGIRDSVSTGVSIVSTVSRRRLGVRCGHEGGSWVVGVTGREVLFDISEVETHVLSHPALAIGSLNDFIDDMIAGICEFNSAAGGE